MPEPLSPRGDLRRVTALTDSESRLSDAEEAWLLTCPPHEILGVHVDRICASADSLTIDLVERVASALEGEAARLRMLANLKEGDASAKAATAELRYNSEVRGSAVRRLRALLNRMHQRQKALRVHANQHGGAVKTQVSYWYWRAAKAMLHPDDLEEIRAEGRRRMEAWLSGGTPREEGCDPASGTQEAPDA